MILTYIAKKVYVLIYVSYIVTAFINFCTQIFYKFHKLFPQNPRKQIWSYH